MKPVFFFVIPQEPQGGCVHLGEVGGVGILKVAEVDAFLTAQGVRWEKGGVDLGRVVADENLQPLFRGCI